ncbi:MAG: histidine triad nucleotide-binding protein [bacterium]|nr:histidine triad nucleotide-binding protein [bacterium]
MVECTFCKIISGKIQGDILYEDDKVVAFSDINPQAPVHVLIVPKKHIPTILDVKERDMDIVSHIYSIVNRIAEDKGLSSKGFRVVLNCKDDGGQAVYHLHFHLLGGRRMNWPAG